MPTSNKDDTLVSIFLVIQNLGEKKMGCIKPHLQTPYTSDSGLMQQTPRDEIKALATAMAAGIVAT